MKINEELKKYNIKTLKYTNVGNITIVDTNDSRYVIKRNNYNDVYNYLKVRNYSYYPEVISDLKDSYIITKYISSNNMPDEQKIDDIIDLISLLHNKTTHFKEVDSDEYHRLYDDLNNNIIYLFQYYNDLMTIIESKIYFSPPEYLLARNISNIYLSLDISKKLLDKWYENVKSIKNKKIVILHNNLKLDHFIYSDKPYLISWDKSRIDMPIFDIYKLYKNEGDKFSYDETLKRYEKDYPLKDYERNLFFILLLLPPKIEFKDTLVNMCIEIDKVLKEIDKANEFISPYYLKDS